MTINEFITYLESLMTAKDAFYVKFTENEETKNMERSPAKRWNETIIERAVDKHWLEFMNHIYDQVATKVKVTTPANQGWLDFINSGEFINSLDQSIHEMEIEED
ncbi:hypothetical protein [Vagococcus salmoninarum]|uniref:hypothetical protein n=1 Tax=Vagococcus salmoninarum TaxID=2739 RepID=UPI003F9D82B6